MARRSDPPLAVLVVLDVAVDALLVGSHGWLSVPSGGNMRCDWLPNKGCYRVTVDVAAGRALATNVEDLWMRLRRRVELELEAERQRVSGQLDELAAGDAT